MEGEVEFTLPNVDKPCKTWYKVFGDLKSPGRRPLVALHGGPGAVHNYFLSLSDLVATHSIPVVLYDQLGSGNSTHLPDKMGDEAFWTEDLFIAQLKSLLAHLDIHGDFDLLGHSWGGMLAARFATLQPPGLKRLVIANSLASMKLWVEAANRLRSKLPEDVQAALSKHEADGTTDSKEYHDAMNVFYQRHVCRLEPWPSDIVDTFKQLEVDPTVYLTMNGPSEFYVTGSIKDWSILDEMHKINVPTLLLNSQYDEAQDSTMAPYFHGLSKVKWFTFDDASHMPQYEQREKYMQVLGGFLTMDV